MSVTHRIWIQVVAASALAISLALGTAPSANSYPVSASPVPLSQIYRGCDFTPYPHVAPTGYGYGAVEFSRTSGIISARVSFAGGQPNTRYLVRLIEIPRYSGGGCSEGDPGTTTVPLYTDNGGVGIVEITSKVVGGASAAWVLVDLPSERSQTSAEFYTTDILVAA